MNNTRLVITALMFLAVQEVRSSGRKHFRDLEKAITSRDEIAVKSLLEREGEKAVQLVRIMDCLENNLITSAIFKLLLSKKPTLVEEVGSQGKTLLHAILHKKFDFTSLDYLLCILSYKPDVNAQDDAKDTPLHKVFHKKTNGYIERWTSLKLIGPLLEHGADVNLHGEDGNTPLHYAAKHCDKDTFKLLLAGGRIVKAKTKETEV